MRNLKAHSVQTPVKPGKPCALSAQICRKIMANVHTQGRTIDTNPLSMTLHVNSTADCSIQPSRMAERDANPRHQAQRVYLVEVQNKSPHQASRMTSSCSGTTAKTPSKYSKEQWIQQRPEIYKLYIKEGLQLSTVKARMDSNGLHATEPMYKRKFNQWGWKKYRKIYHYAKSKQSSARAERENGAMDRSGIFDSKSTVCVSVAHSAIVPYISQAQFTAGIPTMTEPIELEKHMQAILLNVRSLYMGCIDQGKWKIANPRRVEERVYDDFLVEIAAALQNFKSLGPKAGGCRRRSGRLKKSLPTVVSSLCPQSGKGFV
ncbi:hypothetical protein BDZ45DRAFT_365093 [Acephala macrosclerotiorum]|nr:hypothetical protein BDZ45DRAFT_365093 [Acephala macrosclerotiorum]